MRTNTDNMPVCRSATYGCFLLRAVYECASVFCRGTVLERPASLFNSSHFMCSLPCVLMLPTKLTPCVQVAKYPLMLNRMLNTP